VQKPKIEGGEPVRDEFLPFAQPWITEEEIEKVSEVLRSGWLTSGPNVSEFEKKFGGYVGAKCSIATNSCTGALHVSLLSLGVGQGDEVITTPHTYAATGHVIAYVGAKPVLADIKSDTFNIDPEKIKEKITDRTKAIIPVHYAGQPCDMDEIMGMAEEHDLFVVEDAAHAIGAEYKGKKIGTMGDTTCYSFYAIKNMTTGEGGMITTDREDLEDTLRKFTYFGINKDAWKRYQKAGKWYYEVERLGYKYNMMDMQAAIGLVQLNKLDEFNETRRKYAKYLTKKLGEIPEIQTPSEKGDVKHVWHLYPILVKTEELKIDRNKFIDAMVAENIGMSLHFIPLHRHPYYQETFGYKEGDLPVADYVYERITSLPLYPKMSKDDLDDVVEAVQKIVSYYRKS